MSPKDKHDIEITPSVIQAVHREVAKIPSGKVATYGQIADLAGVPGAAREVGHIMSRVTAQQNLPCHRVVNKAGSMAPDAVFGGQEKQRAMLEAEGITFTASGHIDMERHQMGSYEQLRLF